MKKLLIMSCVGIFSIGLCVAELITVIPYGVNPSTARVVVLLGNDVYAVSVGHSWMQKNLSTGVWSLPRTRTGNIFSWKSDIDVAAEMFNQRTVYAFARALVDDYAESPKSSCGDPCAGYSRFIPGTLPVDIGDQAEAELVEEWGDDGSYGTNSVNGKKGSMKEILDETVKGVIEKQFHDTPLLCVGDHFYYFIQIPFLPAQFLTAKRAGLDKFLPGTICFGSFEPEPKVVGLLGAALTDFVWVDGHALIVALQTIKQKPASRRYMGYVLADDRCFELDASLAAMLCEDSGVIDTIARVVDRD